MSERRIDEHAEHDAEFSALYRGAQRDEPPSRLDEAIRAAARRAVGARPRPARAPFSRRWGFPVAVAAVLVLSVTLVILVREEAPHELAELRQAQPPRPLALPPAAKEDRSPEALSAKRQPAAGAREREAPVFAVPPSIKSEEASPQRSALPAPPVRAAEPVTKERMRTEPFPAATAPVPTRSDAGIAQPEQRPMEESTRGTAAGQQRLKSELGSNERPSAAQPSNPAAPPAADQSARRAQSNAGAEKDVQEMRDAQAPALRQGPWPATAGALMKAPQPAEKWLSEIEDLHKQGRTEEARKSLAEFLKRYPDYPVPSALKDALRP
jgi:hypothetical protein